MRLCLKVTGLLLGIGVLILLLWIGWNIISYQSFVYNFQNSTYEPMSVFRVEDDQGYVIAMQRTDTFHPGERKSIGGIDSGMPLYLLISSGSEEKKRQSKLYVSKDLPLKVWFKLTFIPWRYRAEFIVSVLPEGRAGLSWILKDNTNNRRKLACGGWLVDRYRMDVVEEFKNFRFDEDHPREHVLCNPLAYTESERLRIESELSKK